LTHAVEELRKLVSQQPKEKDLFDIINIFGHFDELSALLDIKSLFIFTNYFFIEILTGPDFGNMEKSLGHLNSILLIYSKFVQRFELLFRFAFLSFSTLFYLL